jgi:hypothetical protein
MLGYRQLKKYTMDVYGSQSDKQLVAHYEHFVTN